jgi:peptide/nickel transport system ATP-binding protein
MTLEVRQRSVAIDGVPLVNDFSLIVEPGQVHGVVGESGSGKSLSALSVMDLLPPGATIDGTVFLDGTRVTHRQGMAMVLQEPLGALNPVLTIESQLVETMRVHGAKGELHEAALRLLEDVGLPEPEQRLRQYPHQLSGGQRQRVAIACALAARPRVLIADEPTTALDASLKLVILSLLRTLARERQLAVWLITHDLRSAREACDAISVMYAGRVVETGPASTLLSTPRHPYTRALLASTPESTPPGTRLPTIGGQLPKPGERVEGCRFHPRCPARFERCVRERPVLHRGVACHLVEGAP